MMGGMDAFVLRLKIEEKERKKQQVLRSRLLGLCAYSLVTVWFRAAYCLFQLEIVAITARRKTVCKCRIFIRRSRPVSLSLQKLTYQVSFQKFFPSLLRFFGFFDILVPPFTVIIFCRHRMRH